ncbi:electron carrier/ protein disulfide oxidoreductase [Anaeramoeba flamelloides]|uniref:Electron carrier/ protein disulfide oxidoreductase n=1 Tax=Anaeramoeba flamelloides TaxID=1746091 RepID=A0ABQ8YXX4_9EUKA|nr:electron carrier/ protein disulfide oxidoreductase [Anaeramoeba flamelloides]
MTHLLFNVSSERKSYENFGSITQNILSENMAKVFQQIKNPQLSYELAKKTKKINSSLKKLATRIKEFENQSQQIGNIYQQKKKVKDSFLFLNQIKIGKANDKKSLTISTNQSQVRDPKNVKKIKKKNKKIRYLKESIQEIENKQYDETKNERIETIQSNLRIGVNENNRVRDYLNRKKSENNETEEKVNQIRKTQKEGSSKALILKNKKEQISELQTVIKRKQFDHKKLIKIFETKSNVSTKEKLEAYKLQVESKKQEAKRLESELHELQQKYGKTLNTNFDDSISSMSESDRFFGVKTPRGVRRSKSTLYSEDERWKEPELTELSSSANDESEKIPSSKDSIHKIQTDEQKSDLEEIKTDPKIEVQPKQNLEEENEKEKEEEKENENNTTEEKKKKKQNEKIDIKDIQTLLTIPAGVEYFKEYLVQGMSHENLLFYLDVKNFKNIFHKHKNIYQVAKNIYKKYIKNESIFEVNIDYNSRETIEQLIKEKKISYDMFNHAQEIVLNHMDHNEFNPFKKSKIYKILIKQLKTHSHSDFDIKTKKAILVTKTNETQILNTEFHFQGKARKTIQVSEELMESMIFILNSQYSVSTKTIELNLISKSLSFNRFVAGTTELQRITVATLTHYEKVACFINIYNTLLFHIAILYGLPPQLNELKFFNDFKYNIGGHFFSLNDIRNGVLRNNKDRRNNPYFKKDDPRREYCLKKKFNPKIHFCLNNFNYSTMIIQTVYQHKIKKFISHLTKSSLSKQIFLQKKKLFLPKLFQEYAIDFGNSKSNVLKWIHRNLNLKRTNKKMHFNETTTVKFYKNNINMTHFIFNKKSQMVKKFADFN